MGFTRQYKQFLRPEKRVSKGLIKPRNIYRITTYKGGEPATKSGEMQDMYLLLVNSVINTLFKINPINQ